MRCRCAAQYAPATLKRIWTTHMLPGRCTVRVYVPTNLPIGPICKLAGQSANLRLAIQFANGTTSLKITFEVCSLSVKHILLHISSLAHNIFVSSGALCCPTDITTFWYTAAATGTDIYSYTCIAVDCGDNHSHTITITICGNFIFTCQS